jgi:hypothetical protein
MFLLLDIKPPPPRATIFCSSLRNFIIFSRRETAIALNLKARSVAFRVFSVILAGTQEEALT